MVNAVPKKLIMHTNAEVAAIAKALGVSRTSVINRLKPDAAVVPPADNAEGSMSIEGAVEKAVDPKNTAAPAKAE